MPATPSWVARDKLAHELMYFSRGNPVIYYGDEQGFTGSGGDQVARQTMFASQVPAYLDDDLLGTDATHAADNFVPSHPLYRAISRLSDVTDDHPALRNGAQQVRYASEGAGVFAFSRIDRKAQREYVVVLNNSESVQSASIPTYVGKRSFQRVYGTGASRVKTHADRTLDVTVQPLSAVVYKSEGRIPRSKSAPAITLQQPAPAEVSRGRMHVAADVAGSSFYEVTFQAKVGNGAWRSIGTDDSAPYQVFHDTSTYPTGTPLQYRAVVLDNGGHTRLSQTRGTAVPVPVVTIEAPREGSGVRDRVEVRAVVDPEKASHVVRIERQVDGETGWTPIGTDSTSPAYTVFDSLAPLGLATGHVGEVPGRPAGRRRSHCCQCRPDGPIRRQHARHDGDAALLPAGRRLQRRDPAVLGPAHVGRRGRPGGAGPDRLGQALAGDAGGRRLGRVRHPAGGRHQAGELHHAPAQR